MKLYENFQIIWHKVTTIWVFEYFSEFTTGPNTNSTIRAQLFKYQIIQIIRSNSGSGLTLKCLKKVHLKEDMAKENH